MDSSRATPMASGPEAGEARFDRLERTLEQFQENARHLGVIASDFASRSQEPLNHKIHTLISGLQELDSMKNDFDDVKVPLELMDVLDQGRNPLLYTRDCLERTVQKNKEVNGKIEMYKKFHASLLKHLGEELPEDTAKYRNLRDAGGTTGGGSSVPRVTVTRAIPVVRTKRSARRVKMSIGANAVMRPTNAASAALIKAVPHFLGLRLSWTHNSMKSEGIEQFLDEHLPIIRENNPHLKYHLYRTHTECDPFVVGDYIWGRARKKRVSWKSHHQILSMVEEMMAHAGDYREGKRRGVNRRLPRGQELWDTETMGHDVFAVYSKWKGDPKPADTITWKNHPNLTYRKY